MTQPIFMVGARGAGKTTVGNALARALGYQFTDTDVFMQQTTGLSVADVVAREGWVGFRRRESDALKAVTAPHTVVATGGGAVLAAENRAFMRDAGRVIYLRAPATTLAHRLEEYPLDAQRPTLTGKPINEEMVEVLAAREALYQEVAHHVLDATASPAEIVAAIQRVLQTEPIK
ncbi:shikimate kinase AroL [Chimaeribacter californicus]|uniref:Shikimate kinase 2 n=1 Tax=Chimaeribacter californicus TaxID=2060067 RepID=A0A2N5E9Q2_9GAMM|nr:shikimate kinase AroL [Chimaeribacter californicus]PLR38634.1 shikimate kinase AroL [Chimaeribacter californicus]